MFAVLVIGGGLGYMFYLKTRPKKQTWKAKVYTISDAIKSEAINKQGKIVKKLALKDLKPYSLDIIEKIEKKPGITVYRLQKLNKPVPPIDAELVENWGLEHKEVHVLYAGGECTLLKKGYEDEIGTEIYEPMPTDRINLLSSHLALKKNRLQNEKDILQAITPWIVAGMTMLALVGIVYIVVAGLIEINERASVALEKFSEQIIEIEEARQGKPLKPSVTLGSVEENTAAG